MSNSSSKDTLEQISTLVKQWSVEERPSWDDYFLGLAIMVSSRSTCSRLQVGCILVTEQNRIIATGYNGFLTGSPHISRVRNDHEQGTVHAEQNAITDAAFRGAKLEGATAYITHYPCVHCFKMLMASGVKKVKYKNDYKNDPIVEAFINESSEEIEVIAL